MQPLFLLRSGSTLCSRETALKFLSGTEVTFTASLAPFRLSFSDDPAVDAVLESRDFCPLSSTPPFRLLLLVFSDVLHMHPLFSFCFESCRCRRPCARLLSPCRCCRVPGGDETVAVSGGVVSGKAAVGGVTAGLAGETGGRVSKGGVVGTGPCVDVLLQQHLRRKGHTTPTPSMMLVERST